MDELLLSRVNQLKEIEDRLYQIRAKNHPVGDRVVDTIVAAVTALQADVKRMIADAEAEYAAF